MRWFLIWVIFGQDLDSRDIRPSQNGMVPYQGDVRHQTILKWDGSLSGWCETLDHLKMGWFLIRVIFGQGLSVLYWSSPVKLKVKDTVLLGMTTSLPMQFGWRISYVWGTLSLVVPSAVHILVTLSHLPPHLAGHDTDTLFTTIVVTHFYDRFIVLARRLDLTSPEVPWQIESINWNRPWLKGCCEKI